ncbi:MAG: HEAT repeat domain-containing protein [Acidimicrobiales bacterium]|jgi:HEAT repeat protein
MGKGVSGDHQPATVRSSHPGAPVRDAVIAGHDGDLETASRLVGDRDPAVRAAALGALQRMGALETHTLGAALRDPDPTVRRRGCVVAARRFGAGEISGEIVDALVQALASDPDPTVVEAAAWSLGEAGPDGGRSAVDGLERVVRTHSDPLCREAAVAALGAIGDPVALDTVLVALADKPAVRRRATIALAAFDDPRVDEALRRCLEDRDWQVRQAAEDLLGRL